MHFDTFANHDHQLSISSFQLHSILVHITFRCHYSISTSIYNGMLLTKLFLNSIGIRYL